MPSDDVLNFVSERMDWLCSSDSEGEHSEKRKGQKVGESKTQTVARKEGGLKRRTKGRLIGFWRDGKVDRNGRTNLTLQRQRRRVQS
ncbi:MAG: hypothetical protein CMJ78_25085 [Planctomycetaceae bacterium]|nr:hypothetical protein [Planctomycetaceae bacterium]